MRVLVISCEPFLTQFLNVVNKDLDIAAIIIPTFSLIKDADLKNDNRKMKLYSYAYLKECVLDKYYEYIIVAVPRNEMEVSIIKELEKYNIDRRKIFRIGAIFTPYMYRFNQMFNYICNKISDYKILVTGISYAWRGTDITCYSMPTLNCALKNQDLYYDYQFAQKLFNTKKSSFKYAVIGICPYSFHYEEFHAGGGGRRGITLSLNILYDVQGCA